MIGVIYVLLQDFPLTPLLENVSARQQEELKRLQAFGVLAISCTASEKQTVMLASLQNLAYISLFNRCRARPNPFLILNHSLENQQKLAVKVGPSYPTGPYRQRIFARLTNN